MADIAPNLVMVRQRIVMDIAKLRSTVERQKFEQMEMEDRRVKNEENIRLSMVSIEEYEQKLKDFDEDFDEDG